MFHCFTTDSDDRKRNLDGRSTHSSNIQDQHLDSYRNLLIRPLVTEVHLEHNFLDLKEEGILEQHAIFSKQSNLKTISLLLSHFDLERLGENVVIVSTTSFSTQVYHRGGVLGSIYMGSTALIDNPSLVLQIIRQVVAACRSQGLHIPIVFCNSIGRYVNQSINLLRETTESVEKMINMDGLDAAIKSRDPSKISFEEKKFAAVWMLLTLMMQEAVATDTQLVLKSHKKPTLDYDWIAEKARVCSERLPCGIYIADFNSEAFIIYYYDPKRSESTIVSKDTSFINGENSILKLVKTVVNIQESPLYNKFILYIRDKVTIHALSNNVVPIVCHIVQTGPMRQQHYLGDMLPHVELIL
eukprot:gene811-1584_t